MIGAYYAFISLYFQSYAGAGHDAKLPTVIQSEWGDRQKAFGSKWSTAWSNLFVSKQSQVTSREAVTAGYFRLMEEFSQSLGLGIDVSSSKRNAMIVSEAIASQKKAEVVDRNAETVRSK